MSNKDRDQMLREAAEFYKSLPVDAKFVGVAGYHREKFSVTDPSVVRESIKHIREHLSPQDFWEAELKRLEEEIFRRCQAHSDIPIYVAVEEWSENMVADAKQYFQEEYAMAIQIGTKVRNIWASYGAGTIVRYGIVRANQEAYIVNRDPFEENTIHDYKMHPRPRLQDCESAEAFDAAVREYDQKEKARQENIIALANMLAVEWFDCEGNKLAEGWANANTLRPYGDEDEKADSALPLVSTYGTPKKAAE